MTILDPRLWLGIVMVALSSYGAGRWQQHRTDERSYAAERLSASLDAQKHMTDAVNAVRDEERRKYAAVQDEVKNATKLRIAAEAAARRADAASVGLRARVSQLLADARSRDAGTAAGSTSESDAIGVLADVLGRVDERAGILAKAADTAHREGLACERISDKMMVGPAK